VSRFQFVADHSDAFEVKWLCAVLEIARSSFYAWVDAAETRTAQTASDDVLAQRIWAVHAGDTTYGAPRITAELNDGVDEVERVNHKRVARVMRTAGIAGYRREPVPGHGDRLLFTADRRMGDRRAHAQRTG
jgi:hypothetical protein